MKRVVVTGLGCVTPLGNDLQSFWDNILKGVSGTGPITRFNAEKFKVRIASEVKNFAPETYLDRNEIKRSDLFTQYALYAATQAIEDSGINFEDMDAFDAGVIWGTGQGGMETFEQEVTAYNEGDGTPRFSPFFVPKLIANMASGLISIKHGLRGINYTTVSACATSNSALMDALNYIRWGKAKVIVTGGSEAPITPASVGGFASLKAMSTRNDDPGTASRPYDVNRDGFVMGEGAGALILEEYEHAKARGARIYAELIGAAMTSDAYHMTAPHPDGIGAAKGMQLALKDAGITPQEVDYLNPHATSTHLGDQQELKAIRSVFGPGAGLDISATKSMTGHMLGAAGAAEAIISIMAINHNVVPATINVQDLDKDLPEVGNLVIGTPKEKPVNVAMSNAFGFGGHNAIAIFRKV